MSLGRARKSVEPQPLAPYSPCELRLVTADFRAQSQRGEPITNLEIAAAARRAGFSASTMRRRIKEPAMHEDVHGEADPLDDPQLKPKRARLTRDLRIEIVLRGGNVAKTHRDLSEQDWPGLPGLRTLQRLVKALPLAEAVSLRKGEGEARKFDLVLLRSLTHRNAAWFMDAFYCRWLVRSANGRGICNAWAVVIVDGASGAIAAILAVREEHRADGTVSKVDSLDALHAMGDAMRAWPLLGPVRGRPKILYHDNAGCFTGDIFQLPLADRLVRVKTETTAPYTPWQNGPAESTIGSLRKLLARPLEDGTYLDPAGNSLIETERRVVDLVDLQTELIAAAIEFNQLPFRDDRKISKAEAYERLPGEINPVSREILSRFLRTAEVPVRTHGVTIEREHFTHNQLRSLVGRVVEVRYYDMDDHQVEVWWAGKYRCTAKNVRYFTDEDREAILFPRSSSRVGRQAILQDAALRSEDWVQQRRAERRDDDDPGPPATDSDPWGDDGGDA
jgi:transposase InsO family protein